MKNKNYHTVGTIPKSNINEKLVKIKYLSNSIKTTKLFSIVTTMQTPYFISLYIY